MKKLFIFEGPDGCGKSTQVEMLEKKLKALGKKVKVTREPGGTELGELLRNILITGDHEISKVTEMYLFAASRRALNEQIAEWIEDGYTVICDRGVMSSMVYQQCDELDMSDIYDLNSKALDPLSRYMGRREYASCSEVLFFNIDLDTYKKRNEIRLNSRGLDNVESRYVKDSEIKSMLASYKESATRYKAHTIDANRSIEEMHMDIINLL